MLLGSGMEARKPAKQLHKVIRDPVHNLITLSGDEGQLILDLIDRPEFQRLRRIRQLGVGFLTYPGAEHSRFTHSLGVCHLARRMLDALRGRYGGESSEYSEIENLRREILVAALLHDVGHGPFSHVFERAIPEASNPPTGYPRDHEGWSERIIQECFGKFLANRGVNVEVVTGLINKKNRQNLLAKDFISSQLDADRMDYLLRDSQAAGPKYGHFDIEWLHHSLRIGRVSVKNNPDGVWRLCFDSQKAIHVVEEYIQAREFMYLQVYLHKTTRAYEALLKNIFELAREICGGDPDRARPDCPPALAKMLAGQPVETAEYLSLDDFRVWSLFIDWSLLPESSKLQAMLARKCRQLVNREQPYKFIELDNRDKQDNALRLVANLQSKELKFSCLRDAFEDLAYRNARYRKSKDDDEEEDRVIYFVEPEHDPKPAENLSAVIDAISQIKTEIYRLYYDENDAQMMERLHGDEWSLEP
jgi:hypothetical protein